MLERCDGDILAMNSLVEREMFVVRSIPHLIKSTCDFEGVVLF